MRKIAVLVLVLLFLSGTATGCFREQVAPVEETVETIEVFYGDQSGEKLVSEEREIRYGKGDDKYQLALEELIRGPEDETLTAPISRDTKVYGTIVQHKDIIVNVSQEFTRFPGSAPEIIGVASLVNTLTRFEEIDRVKILVEGEELLNPAGFPYGFMDPFPPDPGKTEDLEVLLYFSDAEATDLVTESRVIQVHPGAGPEGIALKVLEELILGPENPDYKRTIPPEAGVRFLTVEDGICHVDFSEEMHTRHWGGAAGEAFTIRSLIYTLTELEFVDKIKVTVEGSPLSIEHVYLQDPVGREDLPSP